MPWEVSTSLLLQIAASHTLVLPGAAWCCLVLPAIGEALATICLG